MNISFIIITNNNKKEELSLQIESIKHLNIPNYEIILAGIIDQKYKNQNHIKYIEDEFNAKRGSLGGMRNNACSLASYDNLVISDDDMLFCEDWYINFQKINQNFDIITPRVKLPDGTRFWDHACYMSPEKGHIMLNPEEKDDYLYMSGGQSWVIKKQVWAKIKWDEEFLIYKMKSLDDYHRGIHNEDTDFALRCRKAGFIIRHEPSIRVYHNDPSYTSIGRLVRRRSETTKVGWANSLNFPEQILVQIAVLLINFSFEAEAADLLRSLINKNSFLAQQVFSQLEQKNGGQLLDSQYSEDNQEYKLLIDKIKNV